MAGQVAHGHCGPAAPGRTRPSSREDDVTDRLSELSIPTLVVHGELDAAISVPTAQALADGLGGKLVVVPGAGHAANLTHPDATNEAIEAFLATL